MTPGIEIHPLTHILPVFATSGSGEDRAVLSAAETFRRPRGLRVDLVGGWNVSTERWCEEHGWRYPVHRQTPILQHPRNL